jgi:DNA repair protein RadC
VIIIKIKEIPEELRPREKALRDGVKMLSDRELLALFIRQGTRNKSALEVADAILFRCNNIAGINRLSREDLLSIRGISHVKALEIMALTEVAIRIIKPSRKSVIHIEEPGNLVSWLNLEIGFKNQEYFMAVYLDKQNRLLSHSILFKGTLDRSVVHPREIFKEAVRHSASRIILVHNHPGGTLTPSDSDLYTTSSLVEAGNLMGVYILDHLIVTEGNYTSIRRYDPGLFES